MTFNDQIKEAKKKQLENRMLRDIVFLILGITFLLISIIMAVKDNNKKEDNNKISTTTVMKN